MKLIKLIKRVKRVKRTELDPKLKLNHHLTAIEFVAKSVCTTCSITEGACRSFYNGDYQMCYRRCWWFSQAVRKIEKVLDKYDRYDR